MQIPAAFIAGVFAVAMLLVLDRGVWWWVRLGLSPDYETVETWKIPRGFPGRRRFLVAKSLIALAFVTLFIVTEQAGAAQHMGLALSTFAVVVPFAIVSGWEGVRAFRHYAAHHLPPIERGGYIQR